MSEAFFEDSSPDHRKDIDNGSIVTVDYVDVVFAFEVAMLVTVDCAFTNSNGFGKLADIVKADQIEDGADDRFGRAVFFCNGFERQHFYQ